MSAILLSEKTIVTSKLSAFNFQKRIQCEQGTNVPTQRLLSQPTWDGMDKTLKYENIIVNRNDYCTSSRSCTSYDAPSTLRL